MITWLNKHLLTGLDIFLILRNQRIYNNCVNMYISTTRPKYIGITWCAWMQASMFPSNYLELYIMICVSDLHISADLVRRHPGVMWFMVFVLLLEFLGLRFLVCMPSFFMLNGRFTCTVYYGDMCVMYILYFTG